MCIVRTRVGSVNIDAQSFQGARKERDNQVGCLSNVNILSVRKIHDCVERKGQRGKVGKARKRAQWLLPDIIQEKISLRISRVGGESNVPHGSIENLRKSLKVPMICPTSSVLT